MISHFQKLVKSKILVKILFTENLQFFNLVIEMLFANIMLKCGIQKPQFFNLVIEMLFANTPILYVIQLYLSRRNAGLSL